MIISKVVHCDQVGFGAQGADIYEAFSGTPYFRFVDDRSNPTDPDNFPDGQPYIYKVIQLDPDDSSIIMSQDFSSDITDKTRNFGKTLDDVDTNEINSSAVFGVNYG